MDEKDRLFIEGLFKRQEEKLDQRFREQEEKLDQRFREQEEKLHQRFREQDERFERRFGEMDRRFERLLYEVRNDFLQHVTKISEDFDGKIARLAEGHQAVIERLERVEASVENLGAKVDRIELRLIAHMADSEAHHGVYRVREAALEYAAEAGIEVAELEKYRSSTKSDEEEFIKE